MHTAFLSSIHIHHSNSTQSFSLTTSKRSHHLLSSRRARPHSMPPIATISTPNASKHTTLQVNADSRSYPILFSEDVLSNPETFKPYIQGDKVLIVSNTTVAPLYMDKIKLALSSLDVSIFVAILPDGEEYKSLQSISHIWDKCMEARLDRKSTLIALGGGVIGDITGFAAASFVRGIPFIQVPTTLLSVVDSSVGGKTAINHPMGKNMIGAFYQPHAVIVDSQVLKTLDDRQLSAGIAEVIKYGIIRDWNFFEWCEMNIEKLKARDVDATKYAMIKSCQHKADIVAQDEKESGLRATLNLGHTFGHAIEASMGYGEWLHGEAIAAGMVMACEMSVRLGWISNDITQRVEKVLAKALLPIRPPPTMNLEKFMTYMSVDKKVEAGVLRLILLKDPGHAVLTADFPEDILFDTIMHYHQLYKANPGKYEHALNGLTK